MSALTLPKRAPGRKSATVLAAEQAEDLRLCQWLEEHRRRSGFAFGARGWGYVCEGESSISRGQLDAFEAWLVRVRQEGLIDPNLVSDDDSCAADNVEQVDTDDLDAIARYARDFARYRLDHCAPINIWEGLEVMVEKIDLKLLFGPVGRKLRPGTLSHLHAGIGGRPLSFSWI